MAESLSKRPKLNHECESESGALQKLPHESLEVPFESLEPGQIRVRVLHPGKRGEPLVASIDMFQLLDTTDGGPGAGKAEEDSEDIQDDVLEDPIKFMHKGNTLFSVPADDNGDGSECFERRSNAVESTHTAGEDDHYDEDEDFVTFEAISYVWGALVFSQSIKLQDHGILRITESLHSALQRFRLEDSDRTLWADAICINQPDLPKRNVRVAMMAQIYQLAERVLVWLGPSKESDALAFAALTALSSEDVLYGEDSVDPVAMFPRLQEAHHLSPR